MPTPPLSDEEIQRRLDAYHRHGGPGKFGSGAAAAKELGIDSRTLYSTISLARERGFDPAVQTAMRATGALAAPTGFWLKTKGQDGEPDVSAYFRAPAMPDDTLQRIREAFEGMEPAAPVEAPERVLSDLLTVYPVMDAHWGMQAWGRETGGPDYDVKLAAQDLRNATAKVLALTPDAEKAVIIIGGDFFHNDNQDNVTFASGHQLDVDSRFFKILETGIAAVKGLVEAALAKHRSVTVRVLRGNHDPHSHMVLTFALAERYREEPRVEVDTSPRDLFMLQHGRCLIAAHHGDKAPPERLTLYLSDVCPYWSETRHRYCLTGHIHKDQARDVGPLRWRSLRAFCPPDAYAAGMGYTSRRAMQALTFDARDGLVLEANDPIERARD